MSDPNWKYPHQYADPSAIFEGEIGKIEGVRFIESTEAKVFHADDLSEASRTLKVGRDADGTSKIFFSSDSIVDDGELCDRYVIIDGKKYFVEDNTKSFMTLKTDSTKETDAEMDCTEGTIIYPGEAGAEGADVYVTLIFGENAYGTTELANGGLEHIVKQLGSGGSSDPLNQRATVGWKATKVTTRLVEAFMIRIETTASA